MSKNSKDAILSTLRIRAEELLIQQNVSGNNTETSEIAILLNELEIHELELDMQTDELRASYKTTEMERSKFAGFFNSAPIGYFILDLNGTIKELNQAGSELFHQHKDEIIGKRFTAWVVPDMQNDFYAFISSIVRSDKPKRCDLRIKASNGNLIFSQLGGTAIKSPGTGEIEYYITLTDITESKNAAQNLRDTTERLNQTLKASVTGTWGIWPIENRVFLDEFSNNILGIEDYMFNNTVESFLNLVVDQDKEQIRSLCKKSEELREVDMEIRLSLELDRQKIIMMKGREVFSDEGNRYFTGILFDISERKHAIAKENEDRNEQQRLLTQAAINAQEKERNKISSALHDSICQLLYGIRFNLYHLKADKNQNDLSNLIMLIDQAIREIRDISYELSPSILKDFGFTAGIREMAERLSHKTFTINCKIHQDADKLPEEIQLYIFRIIQELLNNSIKHSQANKVQITVCIENKQANIVVWDNGKGIDENLEVAFKNGSGLRGIKNRVSMLNGDLNIQNQQGARFTISFDLSKFKDN